MDMKHCLLPRLLGLVPLLLGISFLSFVLIQLSPGDPAEVVIRVNDMTPTPELLAEVRTQLGLDRPFPERYLRWLADVLRGDLGTTTLIPVSSISVCVACSSKLGAFL